MSVRNVQGSSYMENPIVTSDMEREEGNGRSSADFQFVVENVSTLSEPRISKPFIVRDLEWKIMITNKVYEDIHSKNTDNRYVGFFLLCNNDSENTNWSVDATAMLHLIAQKEGCHDIYHKVEHLFRPKEENWGYALFVSFKDLTDISKGYIKNDTVIFEVRLMADIPQGWDSKKHTGYIGLKNRHATNYLNSLLQSLYFTNQLRKAVYKIPTESDDSNTSVVLALQRVFHELQFYDQPVSIKKFTKSFGRETLNSFMENDCKEFLRVLLGKIENKMNGTSVEGTIPKLFEGKMISYINCKNVDYTSTRTTTFYNIKLKLKGNKNIYESFEEYTQVEILDGNNRYYAGEHGLQDAERGIIFASFPPVFYIHLEQYPVMQHYIDAIRFEFYDKINLDQYLKVNEDTPADYVLHAVIVRMKYLTEKRLDHSRHYVVFINPKGDGKWYKFEDDLVSRCSKVNAIYRSYGDDGDDDTMMINANTLVYIRNSELKNVLQEVTTNDIPKQLVEKLQNEKHIETIRLKEHKDLHKYINIQVFLEDCFDSFLGIDLFDIEQTTFRTVKVKATNILEETHKLLAETFHYQSSQIRIWPLIISDYDSLKLTYLDVGVNASKTIQELQESSATTWNIWLELVHPGVKELMPFNRYNQSLIFLKLFIPEEQILVYCGYVLVSYKTTLNALIPLMNERADFQEDTRLIVFKKSGKNEVEKISTYTDPICEIIQTSTYGEVLIFQKEELTSNYVSLVEHVKNICSQVDMTFCDILVPNDSGFTLKLPTWMLYQDMLQTVAERVSIDQRKLQIYYTINGIKECAGDKIKYSYNGPICNLLTYKNGKHYPMKLFYHKTHMPVNELESKKSVRIILCDTKLNEREIILYLNKNDFSYSHFHEVLHTSVELSPNNHGQFRTLEIISSKIHKWFNPGEQMPDLASVNPAKYYRVERIPDDEIELKENELLIPVCHYSKDIHLIFGNPFLIKIIHDEPIADLKERIVNKTGITDKELDEYTLTICYGLTYAFISDTYIMNLQDFKQRSTYFSK